ncbi:phage terminase large subunit [Oceanicella actignis]|uniref:phage terminase large subunit n=1 Tax=Oceanicella actignis TaxID=1189325 RepID=UPI0012560F21|nr:phage terminase large subunit [Oceanicella actignis]TYO91441.1 putative phage terminase large subunit-like protein [Oceanicella actignis]
MGEAMEIRIAPPELHPGQRRILDDPVRFKVASCGRRFGKTRLACEWLTLLPGAAIEGSPVAYFAPTYKLLSEVFGLIERTMAGVAKRVNRQEMRIELVTGGVVDFWTLEDPDAGRGRRYRRIVIDEAAHARHLRDAWEQAIRPTLTDFRGEAWFISTPKGLNFFHDLFRRGESAEYPDWTSFHMPTAANPHIAPEEIEEARAQLPELVFRQEYLAEFVTMGAGLVKPEMIRLGAAPRDLPITLGVDLAISTRDGADFTAIVAMTRDPKTGTVYVVEAERFRGEFREIVERIKASAERHRAKLVAIEQTQFQAAVVQELARTTKLPIRGVRPDRDKVTRFLPLLTRYEQGMVVHDLSGVPPWFRDELLAFPEGQHDDGVDAAAHAFAALGMSSGPVVIPGRRVF